MQKHFTATVYILARFDSTWKLLLHKHPHIQAWIGVGGHVEIDENPYEAAIREVKEETRLDIEILAFNKAGDASEGFPNKASLGLTGERLINSKATALEAKFGIRERQDPRIKTNKVFQIPTPLMILEEKIPAKGEITAHIHIDCIYLGICHTPGKIKMEEEYGWFTKLQLKKLSLQEEVTFIAKKAFQLLTY